MTAVRVYGPAGGGSGLDAAWFFGAGRGGPGTRPAAPLSPPVRRESLVPQRFPAEVWGLPGSGIITRDYV
ncbi:hypothetical protein GCM10009682_47570 [Luedemannella flava]|uniref:Uncharacterized protein n=1 Tax=Luedemannella flava TaxID=349316 RepID=A0ABN2MED5_9ACTN